MICRTAGLMTWMSQVPGTTPTTMTDPMSPNFRQSTFCRWVQVDSRALTTAIALTTMIPSTGPMASDSTGPPRIPTPIPDTRCMAAPMRIVTKTSSTSDITSESRPV